MKVIFKKCLWILAAAVTTIGLHAQEEPAEKSGFIRFVHAIAPGSGAMFCEIDGSPVRSDGYQFGDVTGGIAAKPGAHEVKIRREGVKDGSTRVNIALNETTILISFAEKVPATDEEPAHWEIRILRLKQLEPISERGATFVSVSQQPELKVEMRDMKAKWASAYVKRLAIAQLPIDFPRGYVPLKIGNQELESIPISDNGNYVVVLYDDADGKTKALNFRDYKYLSAD
jgi:hypothetical protein